MAYPFFENGIASGVISPSPDDTYREMLQAYIHDEWENTTALETICEQSTFGSDAFCNVEVMVANLIGLTSTGMKSGRDFIKVFFRDIDHPCIEGRYYRYNDCFWIADDVSLYEGVAPLLTLRRCNNYLRIIDPQNGSVFAAPCVIDYDMTSHNEQVSRYILTPNNHAVVTVQANKDTMRLFKYNTRYMLGGRPFKLLAYQNALLYNDCAPNPTILRLDLYLDESHANDNIEMQLADNGTYTYSIYINSEDMQLQVGANGRLTSTIMLNGEETLNDTIWTSSNPDILTINNDGFYKVIGGMAGDEVVITAQLRGNKDVTNSINVVIADESSVEAVIMLEPEFSKIRQYETISFKVQAFYNSLVYNIQDAVVSMDGDAGKYLSVSQDADGLFSVACTGIANEPQIMSVSVSNAEPAFSAKAKFAITTVSMMG